MYADEALHRMSIIKDNFPVDACISRNDLRSLTSVLQGFTGLSVQYIGSESLFLKAKSPIEITLKIRPDPNLSSNKRVSKTYREVEFGLVVSARLVRKPKTVFELFPNQHWHKGSWSSMAQIDLGRGRIFSGLSLHPIIAFGIDAQNWVRKYRKSNNGECPDDLRELMVILMKSLSWLHERCMSPNGFLLDSIGFCHGKLNPVLTELAGGAVGKPGRQYIAAKPKPDTQNTSETPSNAKSVKIVKTNQIEEILNKQQHLSMLSPCDLETSRLTRGAVRIAKRSIESGHNATLALAACRDNDSESVAKCFLMLLTGWNEQQINSHMAGLKQAKSVEKFARIINWPLTKQRTTLPRLLGAVQNLLSENPKSLADAHMSKQFQFVILNDDLTEQSLNGGIQVPAGFTVPNKMTNSRKMTPPVSIRQAQNTDADPKHGKRGLGVFAEGEIKKGQFVIDYGGQVVTGTPSLWSVSLRHYISALDGGFCSEFPLETAIQERAFGCLLNSSRIVHDRKRPGNVRLVRELAYIDQNGFLKIPMEAICDINAGEELLWCYDFKAGAAGDLVAAWSVEDEDDEFKAKESKGTCNGYCMCC